MSTGDTTKIDVRERGADGQTSDRRLYMRLSVFRGCLDAKPLQAAGGQLRHSTRTHQHHSLVIQRIEDLASQADCDRA